MVSNLSSIDFLGAISRGQKNQVCVGWSNPEKFENLSVVVFQRRRSSSALFPVFVSILVVHGRPIARLTFGCETNLKIM